VVLQGVARPLAPPVAVRGGEIDGTNWPSFLTITFLGPALAAGVLVVLHCLVREVGGSRAAALWLTVIAGLSTPLAFYARTLFPQLLEALLLALAFRAALDWRRTGRLRWAVALGCVCGLGLMTRAAFAPVVVWLFGYLLLTDPATWRRRLTAATVASLPVVVGGCVTAWYNWSRWGSPFDSGYHNAYEAFSTPLTTGAFGLLLSPGKGLFFCAPVMLVPLVALPALWRHGRAEVILLLGITLTYLGIYGRWYDWEGGLAWGPRFLLALIVPWLALLGRVWKNERPSGYGWAALALFPVGLAVQLPALLMHPKWMAWNGSQLFSFAQAHPVVLYRTLLERGPDDLWLWGAVRGSAAYLAFTVGLAGLVFLAGGLLALRSRTALERWALVPPLTLVAVLLLGVWTVP
jgi:hypothetical protein